MRHLTALDLDPVEAARRLGVETVLDGTIQSASITARLLDTRNGRAIWTAHLEHDGDVLSIEDRIADAVARALGGTLPAKQQTTSAESFRLYIEGRLHSSRRTLESLQQGIESYRRSLDFDPAHALAWSGLADAYLLMPVYTTTPPAPMFEQAREAVHRALVIDPELAEAHTTLGAIHCDYTWQWAEAERALLRAIELKPNYALAHHWLGEYCSRMVRFEEARAAIERALELDPLSLITMSVAGMLEYSLRNFERCIEWQRRVLELDPHFHAAAFHLMLALQAIGDFEGALAIVEHISHPAFRTGRAVSLLHLGDRKAAAAIVAEIETLGDPAAIQLATWAAAAGDRDGALHHLTKAVEQRHWLVTLMSASPAWDAIADAPRFTALLQRVGLPPRPRFARASMAYGDAIRG